MALAADLQAVLDAEPLDLARAALVVARLEYPSLRSAPTLEALERLGRRATERLRPASGAPLRTRAALVSHLLFEEEGFAGNHEQYDDYRNSYLNVVLERRLGIPITLALVYMHVAARAGLHGGAARSGTVPAAQAWAGRPRPRGLGAGLGARESAAAPDRRTELTPTGRARARRPTNRKPPAVRRADLDPWQRVRQRAGCYLPRGDWLPVQPG
jgi:Transglutaminase-like superfamily